MRDGRSRLALYLYVSSTGRVLLWKVSILLLTASGLSSKFSRLSRRPRISLGSSLRWMILRVALMRFTWSWFTLTGHFLESFKVFLKKYGKFHTKSFYDLQTNFWSQISGVTFGTKTWPNLVTGTICFSNESASSMSRGKPSIRNPFAPGTVSTIFSARMSRTTS